MGHLERSESLAKSLGTFKMKQHRNGAVCSIACQGPRKRGDGKGPGKEDSTRGHEQMSQAHMGWPKLSAWLPAISASFVRAREETPETALHHQLHTTKQSMVFTNL